MRSFTSADHGFGTALKAAGWSENVPFVRFTKGNWSIVFDTSSWMEVGTETNPRVFDVPVPEESLVTWTLNLIEHILKADDALTQAKRTAA